MANILLIETATRICSVGVAVDDQVVSLAEDRSSQYSHSAQLTRFISRVIADAGLEINNLNAVAVSMGPGSYTGLRIGVSVAKGLCFGLDIPLVSVNTLYAMATVAKERLNNEGLSFLVPMIDARRMEVYNAVFSKELAPIRDTIAEIISAASFSHYLVQGRVAFFGDGAEKCKETLSHNNALFFNDIFPSATGMVHEAYRKFKEGIIEDVAYFEPFYLKDFVAGKPRVKGLI